MDFRSGRQGRAAAGLAATVIGVLAVVLPAGPASAHAVLQRSNPMANTTVPTPPLEVVLTFSEPVSLVTGKIQVIGPDGARADRGEPVVRDGVVSIPMRTEAPRGTYLVNYRVVSADSHPVAGGFTYSVGAPSAAPASVEPGRADPAVGTAIPLAKYLGYLGLVLIAGPALVLAALWPRRLDRRGPTRLAWLGLGLVGLSTVAGLLLQAPYSTGLALTRVGAADVRDVLGSTFGTLHVVRLGVLVAAALLLRPLLAGRGGTADRLLLAVLAAVGLATWPLSGHAGAAPMRALTVAADAAHLGAMAAWLGGLVMLLGFLLRRASADELDAILPVWSRWAAVAIGVLLLAGTVQALVEVGTPGALVTTTYGWLVLAKVALFGPILGVAAVARRLVRARTAPERPGLRAASGRSGARPTVKRPESGGRLRRLVGVEVTTAAAVLAVAAVLVQTTPARTERANTELAEAQLYSAPLTSELYSLQVDIDPAEAGNNSLHLYAYDKAGNPLPVVEWRATAACSVPAQPAWAALPSAGVEPIRIPVLKLTDNHAIGEIALPTAGQWEFRFTLRLSELDQASVTANVSIK